VLLVVVYNVVGYSQHESALGKMRVAEWIDYDSEGNFYCTHHENVYRLSSSNSSLDRFIESGLKISSRDIMDIAIAPSGEVFLTDPTTSKIHIYSKEGILQKSLDGYFKENARIFEDDKRVYIADMQGDRTLALDLKKGRFLWADENYLIPDSLFVGDSIVYVSDENKEEIRLRNAETGEVIRNIQVNFSGFSYGSAILVLDDGNILLSPTYTKNGSLLKISENGDLVTSLSGPDGFMPVDMALHPDGKVIISDDENYSFYILNNNTIEFFKPDSIDELFGPLHNERLSLEKRASTSKKLLMLCVGLLLGLYVIYKRAT
jgi:outer membrane protein assembly factor BamB